MKAPNILMVGGEKGSWQVRGHQLGTAISARRTVTPTSADWKWADLVVFVKQGITKCPSSLHKTLVWDVLDIWPQPQGNDCSLQTSIDHVTSLAAPIGPLLTIAATKAMAADIDGVYLPHHSQPGLTAKPVRAVAQIVAYHGRVKYLGAWAQAVEQACARIGLTFMVNPPDLSEADIIVAFRDGHWDGDVCRRWKSGVKFVNALAAGRPVLTQPCAAFDEIRPAGTTISDPYELEDALAAWVPVRQRQKASELGAVLAPQYALPRVAKQYRDILKRAVRKAAA